MDDTKADVFMTGSGCARIRRTNVSSYTYLNIGFLLISMPDKNRENIEFGVK